LNLVSDEGVQRDRADLLALRPAARTERRCHHFHCRFSFS
jgi:hypothetical protein